MGEAVRRMRIQWMKTQPALPAVAVRKVCEEIVLQKNKQTNVK